MHTEPSGRRLSIAELPTFNVLHSNEIDLNDEDNRAEDDDGHDDTHSHHDNAHSNHAKREIQESFDFTDVESMAWRKVRFFLFLVYKLHIAVH